MHGLWLAAFILQWALLILLVVVLAGILRYLSALPHDAASPPTEASNLAVGEIIPSFVLPDHRGQTVASKALLSRADRTVLLFVSPGCPACEVVINQLEELAGRPEGLAALPWSFALVSLEGPESIAQRLALRPALDSESLVALYDERSGVGERLGVRTIPVGIALDSGGRVLSQSLNPHVNWIYRMLGVPPPPPEVRLGVEGTHRLYVGPAPAD